MSAVFLLPLPYTVQEGSQQAVAPISNAGKDQVGLVWRSNGLNGVYAILNFASPLDTIALVRNNLRASDSVRVRVGSSLAIVNGTMATVDRTVTAWSGLPSMDGAYTYIPLESAVTGPYVRIDITSTGNAAGYVEVQRIVAGVRVSCDGVDQGASQGFQDFSKIDDDAGYTTVDRYRVRPTWKFTVSDTTQLTYSRDWYPLLMRAGNGNSLLFIPDTDSAYLQTQVTLARITGSPKGDSQSSDFWRMDISLLAV